MSALPTYIGVGTSVAGGTGNTSPRTDISGAVPGDLLVLIVQSQGGQPASAPAGWTEATNSPQTQGTGATSTCISVFTKAASMAELAINATVTVTDTGDHTIGRVHAFRGVDEITGPAPVSAGSTDAVSNTSASAPGLTTLVDNCMVLAIVGNATDIGTAQLSSPANASLANLTLRTFTQTSAGTGGGFDVVTGEMATAGVVSATTGTLASASVKAYITLALIPATHPYLVGVGANGGSSGGLGITWPSGHQADDIGVIFGESGAAEAMSVSGFTEVSGSPQTTAGSETRLGVWWHRATSSSEATATISHTNVDSNSHVTGYMVVVRNCDPATDPVNATAGSTKDAPSTSVSVGGATTTVDKCLVLVDATRNNDSGAAEFSAWADTNLTNFVETFDAGSTVGDGGGHGLARGVLPGIGPTGTATATTTNSVVNAQMAIAMRSGLSRAARFWAAILG